MKITSRLSKPSWPIPTPDNDFIRYSGTVRVRKCGGIKGWVGENEVCEADRFMRLSYCPKIKNIDGNGYFQTRIAFKRLFCDGNALGKFELGIATKSRSEINISKYIIKDLVDDCLNIPVSLRTSSGVYNKCILGHCAKYVTRLYNKATTAIIDESVKEEDWIVSPGIPLLFLDCKSMSDISVPYWSRKVDIIGYPFTLYHCMVPFQGKNIRLWILHNFDNSSFSKDDARRLRIYLLRLNAEHECLRLVLRNILNKNIDVLPRTEQSDRLQFYINQATHRIGTLNTKSNEFDGKLCEIARESISVISPGQKEMLFSALNKIDPRKNILDKINDYVDKIIINYGEITMGDKISDIHQSIISTRQAVTNGIITLRDQGNNELADVVAELDKIIGSADDEIIPKEKKLECAELLTEITEQAKKQNPNKSVMRSLSNSFISVIDKIEPIAKVAAKGIAFLSQFMA